ncbi:hypothetical protein OsccyDRAFT_0004 [Leptolyngbyaceae cyanobacterium JSC-12]|nr:hypothetical protein OsccyDRAFT_0004 [Leptolyngbyaceae cyanobacterium JSC-12]
MNRLILIVLLTFLLVPSRVFAQGATQTQPSSTAPAFTALEKSAQVFQILTGVGTVLLLFQSFRLTKRLKKADILLEFFRRFDQLVDRREAINALGANADSSHYYERFWNLQNDEFTLWREGYIDDKTYEGWLAARHDEYHTNGSTGNMTYKQGWEYAKKYNKDVNFHNFMQKVFDGNTPGAMKIYKKK